MLQKFIESDFELNNLDISRLGFIRKMVKNLSPFYFNFRVIPSFFFLFCNIINIEAFLINRFLLVFWLFTGCFGYISNLKINLRLGIYYYHFSVHYQMKKRKFYNVLSFLLDEILIQQFWDGAKFLDKTYVLYFKNLELFTNYKLARGVYFHRIQQKFYLKLSFENLLSSIFKVYLTSLKLYVI